MALRVLQVREEVMEAVAFHTSGGISLSPGTGCSLGTQRQKSPAPPMDATVSEVLHGQELVKAGVVCAGVGPGVGK